MIDLARIFAIALLCLNSIHANYLKNNTQGISHELVLPFQLYKNLIVIKAFADGQEGFFILDTGASNTILNSNYFTGLINRKYQAKDFAGASTPFREKVVAFNWNKEQPTTSIFAMITNFKALNKLLGIEIMGYIGYDILQDYEVVFDYSQREITLFKLGKRGWRESESLRHTHATDSLQMGKNAYLPYLTISIGGRKLKLGIDSGAAYNLLRKGVIKKLEHNFQADGFVRIAGFAGQEILCPKGSLQDLEIAAISWSPMQCVEQEMDSINSLLDTHLDGLLGFEFLKQHKISINYRKNRCYIWQKEALFAQEE